MDTKVFLVAVEATGWLAVIGGVSVATVFAARRGKVIDRTIGQIDHMSQNCIPTIQRESQATNVHLEKQIRILESIDGGIQSLVNRERRDSTFIDASEIPTGRGRSV